MPNDKQAKEKSDSVSIGDAASAGGTIMRFAAKHGINTTQIIQLGFLVAMMLGFRLPPLTAQSPDNDPATKRDVQQVEGKVRALALAMGYEFDERTTSEPPVTLHRLPKESP
jgi:hypothetical protein